MTSDWASEACGKISASRTAIWGDPLEVTEPWPITLDTERSVISQPSWVNRCITGSRTTEKFPTVTVVAVGNFWIFRNYSGNMPCPLNQGPPPPKYRPDHRSPRLLQINHLVTRLALSTLGHPPSNPSAKSRAAARPGRGGPGEIAIPPVKKQQSSSQYSALRNPFHPPPHPRKISPHPGLQAESKAKRDRLTPAAAAARPVRGKSPFPRQKNSNQ